MADRVKGCILPLEGSQASVEEERLVEAQMLPPPKGFKDSCVVTENEDRPGQIPASASSRPGREEPIRTSGISAEPEVVWLKSEVEAQIETDQRIAMALQEAIHKEEAKNKPPVVSEYDLRRRKKQM